MVNRNYFFAWSVMNSQEARLLQLAHQQEDLPSVPALETTHLQQRV